MSERIPLDPERAGPLDAGGEAERLREAIARRAHQLSESEESSTPEENWLRAERELRGEEPGPQVH